MGPSESIVQALTSRHCKAPCAQRCSLWPLTDLYCCLPAQLYLTLCDPLACSMPGFPVLHCLRSFVQTHVHWVDDAIQPFYPLSPPSPPALNLAQCLESAVCIMWPKYWRFSFSISPSNGYSELISFRIEWFEYCVKRLLFSWVCWIKHRLLLCDLACLHSSWHSLGDFIWTLPRILVLEFFGNKAHCKWLPGPRCASFQALISIASYRARPPSKCRSVEPVLFLCKVSVRIANLLFWNMIGESFCGMWGLSVVVWRERVALKISEWENLLLLEHL